MTKELEDLYWAEARAYRAYQRVKQGDNLVSAQRVSPAKVERARDAWLEALRAYVTAGGTAETTRDIIAGRKTPYARVKRSR